MGTFTKTFDADGTISLNVFDSDTDAAYYDDCNDTPDGLSSDNIYTNTSGETAWLRLEDVPSDFSSLTALSMDVDVLAVQSASDTGTVTAQVFDSDSGGSENPLTDAQTIVTEADTTRTQRTVNFGSLTGTKTQWNNAYCKLSWTLSGSFLTLYLYGAEFDGTYGEVFHPGTLFTRNYLGPQKRSRYGAQMLDKALILARVARISEEQTLLFGSDPVIEGGSLASGRWRR